MKRTFTLITSTLLALGVFALPAFASDNATGALGKDPTTLNGSKYECTLSNPQMTISDGSEYGNVKLKTDPGHLKFDVNSGGDRGYWNDAYLVSGYNPNGYDSTSCNGWGHGDSYDLPVKATDAGNLVASLHVHTVSGFKGDAGYDIWITAPGTGHTASDEEAKTTSTEIMVWLNSPGIDRGGYTQYGSIKRSGVNWQIFGYTGHRAGHRWDYIVFASSTATSRTYDHTWKGIYLEQLINVAAGRGWITGGAVLQSVDAGFEWYEDPSGGTQVEGYNLTSVK
jgi:hypothetical protein